MQRAITLLAVLLSVACAQGRNSAERDDSKFSNREIYLFPEFHDRSAIVQAAWLAYGATLIDIFHEARMPRHPGIIFPSVEQEVAARRTMVAVWRANLSDETADLDPYLEDLRRVEEAGFLSEYVWIYLRPHDWVDPTGLRLTEFDQWRASNLQGHTGQTLLGVGGKRAE